MVYPKADHCPLPVTQSWRTKDTDHARTAASLGRCVMCGQYGLCVLYVLKDESRSNIHYDYNTCILVFDK